MKNGEYAKEAAQIFVSGASGIAKGKTRSEDQFFIHERYNSIYRYTTLIENMDQNATLSKSQPQPTNCHLIETQVSKAIFTILNDRGLHTRPSTEIVKCAANFDAQITLTYKEEQVNAKSLLGILFLAAERGAKITVEAEGPDAEAAVAAILNLATNRFYMKY